MSHLEDELRSALDRVEPPSGFAERVVARATHPSQSNVAPLERPRRRAVPVWIAAAAAALVVVGGTWGWSTRYGQQQVPSGALVATDVPAQVPLTVPRIKSGDSVEDPAPPDVEFGRGNVGPAAGWNRRPRSSRPNARVADDAASRAEAEHAAEQLRIALNITNAKLSAARRVAQSKVTVPAT